jgi:hypothetical protein
MDILLAQLRGEPVHGLIGFLGHGFLHLHLQDQVCAALQVKSELDLMREIILERRVGRGERGHSENEIQTNKNYSEDKYDFPLQVGIHG